MDGRMVRNTIPLLMVAGYIISQSHTAFAVPQGLQATVFAGVSKLHANISELRISTEQSDALEQPNNTDGTYGLGLSYAIPMQGATKNNTTPLFQNIIFGLNYFYYHTKSDGMVNEYGLSQFDNFQYQMNLTTHRIMADVQVDFNNFSYGISPFINASLGVASINTHYYEMPRNPEMIYDGEINLVPRTTNHLAYSLGAGVKKSLTSHISLAMSYLYTHFGTGRTSISSNPNTLNPLMIASPLEVKLQSHTAMFALIYAFE